MGGALAAEADIQPGPSADPASAGLTYKQFEEQSGYNKQERIQIPEPPPEREQKNFDKSYGVAEDLRQLISYELENYTETERPIELFSVGSDVVESSK